MSEQEQFNHDRFLLERQHRPELERRCEYIRQLDELSRDNVCISFMLKAWRTGRIGFEEMLLNLSVELARQNVDFLKMANVSIESQPPKSMYFEREDAEALLGKDVNR